MSDEYLNDNLIENPHFIIISNINTMYLLLFIAGGTVDKLLRSLFNGCYFTAQTVKQLCDPLLPLFYGYTFIIQTFAYKIYFPLLLILMIWSFFYVKAVQKAKLSNKKIVNYFIVRPKTAIT